MKSNSSHIVKRACIFQESHFNSNSLYWRNTVSISHFLSRNILIESDIILNNNLIKSFSSTILIFYQCLHSFLRNILFKSLVYTLKRIYKGGINNASIILHVKISNWDYNHKSRYFCHPKFQTQHLLAVLIRRIYTFFVFNYG